MRQHPIDANAVSITFRCMFERLSFELLKHVFTLLCRELKEGVPVADDNGVVYGNSVAAAQEGIGQVTLSRIFMACPGTFIIFFL